MTLFKDTILPNFIESCIEQNIKENVNACYLFHLKKKIIRNENKMNCLGTHWHVNSKKYIKKKQISIYTIFLIVKNDKLNWLAYAVSVEH